MAVPDSAQSPSLAVSLPVPRIFVSATSGDLGGRYALAVEQEYFAPPGQAINAMLESATPRNDLSRYLGLAAIRLSLAPAFPGEKYVVENSSPPLGCYQSLRRVALG